MFNEHGDFTVELKGNILFLDIGGAWNAETAKTYSHAVLNEIEKAQGCPLAVMTNLDNWELCTPECEHLIFILWQQCGPKGIMREAIVNTNIDSIKLALFRKKLIKDFGITPTDVFKRRFFSSHNVALEWLKNEGYSEKGD